MNTQADAWQWYLNTRDLLRFVQRLAGPVWEDLPWDRGLAASIGFHDVSGPEVKARAAAGLAYLNDLAVVVLFSVFESRVRQQVLKEVQRESLGITHRALRQAVEDVTNQISEGSFFKVMQPFKDQHADLVEEVNQVRRYRNWVAHGKRGKEPEAVTLLRAYHRLNRFVQLLEAGRPAPGGPGSLTP